MAKLLATPEMMNEKFPTLSILIPEPEKITGFSEPNLFDNVARIMRGTLIGSSAYNAQSKTLTINMPSNQEGASRSMTLRFDLNGECIGSELDTIQTQLSELEKIVVEMARSLIASA